MPRMYNRKYDYSNAAKINDLVPYDFCDTFDIPNNIIGLRWTRGKRVKRRFVQKVFFEFIRLIIQDCIDNNVKFISPTRYWFCIYIREKSPQSVRRILNNPKIYQDVNLIQSEGKIYEFAFHSSYLYKPSYRLIRIGHEKYAELVENVNNGKRYYKK